MDKIPINEDLPIVFKPSKKEVLETQKVEILAMQLQRQESFRDFRTSWIGYVLNVLNFLRSLKIEVFVFAFMFSYVIKSISSMTMIMDKVCRVELQYADEVCDNIHNETFKHYKIKVETVANDYHLYHTLIMFIPSIILSIFIGPWSDMHGRKPPLILASIGAVLDGIGTTLCAFYMDSSVLYYLIPPMFNSFCGGMIVVFTVAYSYVSDISTSKNRTFKYALMEVGMGLGAPLGALAGGWIFKFWGYVPVFSCMSIFNLFGLVWVVFLLKETRGMTNKASISVKVKGLLRLSSLVESYKATAKPRPHSGRLQIWMLLLAMSIAVLTLTVQTIAYTYVYHLYDWSNTRYSTVSAIFSSLGLIVMLTAVPLLTKVLKLNDPALGIIGSLSLLAKNIGTGLATYGEGVYYLANLLGFLASLTSLAGRSRISKIVSKNELGKVFSFISSAEGILPVISTILITRLYNATVESNPGLTYFIISGISLFILIIYIWLAILPSVNYEEMQEENTQERKSKDEEYST